MARLLTILTSLLILTGTLSAKDLILRATESCCLEDSDAFPVGSRALLLQGEKVIKADVIENEPSPFEFEDVERGVYILLVWVDGFYPEKFTGNEVGRSGVYDYELTVPLEEVSTAIVEGQITIHFKRGMKDEDVFANLAQWNVGTYWSDRVDPEKMPAAYKLVRTSDFVQARVTYKDNAELPGLIFEILKDEDVLSCSPVYISRRQ